MAGEVVRERRSGREEYKGKRAEQRKEEHAGGEKRQMKSGNEWVMKEERKLA